MTAPGAQSMRDLVLDGLLRSAPQTSTAPSALKGVARWPAPSLSLSLATALPWLMPGAREPMRWRT